jgi:hypothetical protein
MVLVAILRASVAGGKPGRVTITGGTSDMSIQEDLDHSDIDALVRAVRQAVREEFDRVGQTPPADYEMAARWEGGEVVIKPSRPGLAEKVIPIDGLFHKVVMVRERLRVLEQKINNHPKLTDADRLELEDYITRIYGSLTTFNFLFDNRTDWFVGQSGDRP